MARSGAGLAAVLGAVLMVLVPSPPRYAPPPVTPAPVVSPTAGARLVVTASAELADGEQIAVSGEGFPGGVAGITIGECPAGTQTPQACNLAGGIQLVQTDPTGAFGPVTLTVRVAFGPVDCRARGCVLAVFAPGAAPPVRIPLTFAGASTAASLEPLIPTGPPRSAPTGSGGAVARGPTVLTIAVAALVLAAVAIVVAWRIRRARA